MTEFQQIIQRTGASPNNCSCHNCENMCKRTPCLGTPADILRLVHEGYVGDLVPTQWMAGVLFGQPIIYLIALNSNSKGCVMLKNGLCTLHDRGLKPTEGKLASCNPSRRSILPNISVEVARTWEDESNLKTIQLILKAIVAYEEAMKKNKNPFKHFQTVLTPDGHTGTITREETPHRIATHRYQIVITDASGKQLSKFFKFQPDEAVQAAETWTDRRAQAQPLNLH